MYAEEEMARSMEVELSISLNFVISFLYSKLPRRRVDMFGEELEKAVRKKFEGHWYPEKPFKGSAYRCVKVSGEKVDPVMETAAAMSGLDIDEVKENLPQDLSVWIDPNEVSYRIGEKGMVKLLYSKKNNNSLHSSGASDDGSLVGMPSPTKERDMDHGLDSEVQSANRGFNPDAQCFKPIDSLSSSLSNLSMSPSPTGGNLFHPQPHAGGIQLPPAVSRSSYINRSSQMQTGFTAATFAQTKFGSTKLKTQAKRPTRLSPTELGAYMRQKSSVQMPLAGVPNYGPAIASLLPSPGSARAPPHARATSLSPRDPRLELLEYQQRLMYMQPHPPAQMPSSSGLSSPSVGGGSLADLYSCFGQQQPQQPQPQQQQMPQPQQQQVPQQVSQQMSQQMSQQVSQQMSQATSSLLAGLGSNPSQSDVLANPICSSLNSTLQQLQQDQQNEYLQQLSPPHPEQPVPKAHSFGLDLSNISANLSHNGLGVGGGSRAPFLQNTPSPDENKAFLDGLSLPPYQNLQHLLVAN